MSAPAPYEKDTRVDYVTKRFGAGVGTIVHRHPNAESWAYMLRVDGAPGRPIFVAHEDITLHVDDATAAVLASAGLDPNVYSLEKARAESLAELDAFHEEYGTVLAHTLAVMAAHENLVSAVRAAAHFDPALNPGIRAAWVHLAEVDPKAVTL